MNKHLKIGLTLMIIASVFFICSTVVFYFLREGEKEKRIYLEGELNEIIEAKKMLAEDLDEIKIINNDLENKLGSSRAEAQRIAKDLEEEKKAKSKLSAQLDGEKEKSDGLMADIMKEKEERLSVLHQLAKAEEEYSRLKDQYELLAKAKETLEDKIKKMMEKKGVELERIEVKAGEPQYAVEENLYLAMDTTPAAVPVIPPVINNPKPPVVIEEPEEEPSDADVLVVNRKFNFIVANLGRLGGADLGTSLDVYRNGKLIAKTKIEKLYDNMSAATILPEWKNAKIKEGDKIYFSE